MLVWPLSLGGGGSFCAFLLFWFFTQRSCLVGVEGNVGDSGRRMTVWRFEVVGTL
jgi:hypothetical protein